MQSVNLISNNTGKSNLNVIEFFIFNRLGTCLMHIDFQDEVISNKAVSVQTDKKNENRYKLIFGLLFSMKAFVRNLSPNKTNDFFKNYSSVNYKLHYAEFLNGLRFVLITTLVKQDFNTNLKEIYSAYYVNFISKNVFVDKDEVIKNDVFLELVNTYLSNLNQTLIK